jgi:putative ABC transport system ATP-binding protein
MLLAKNISFQYPAGPSFSFPTITCGKNEKLLILGESGKGKTTLLHLLAGLLQPTSGEISINGKNTSVMSGAALDKFRGKNIGIIFQTAHFVEALSVEDNLIMPQYLTGLKQDRTKAKELLTRLNIADKAKKRPSQLSVGEAQRAAIARAVINNPPVILADEPTSALDDKNAAEVIRLLEEQANATGAALIIVTHDQRLKDHFANQITL